MLSLFRLAVRCRRKEEKGNMGTASPPSPFPAVWKEHAVWPTRSPKEKKKEDRPASNFPWGERDKGNRPPGERRERSPEEKAGRLRRAHGAGGTTVVHGRKETDPSVFSSRGKERKSVFSDPGGKRN